MSSTKIAQLSSSENTVHPASYGIFCTFKIYPKFALHFNAGWRNCYRSKLLSPQKYLVNCTAHLIICSVLWSGKHSTSLFFFSRLNSFIKSFGLLNDFSRFVRSRTQIVQFLIFSWRLSCIILSSHLCMGLPLDRAVRVVQLNIFLNVLESGILCTWPNQLSLRALMWLIIFWCFISLSNPQHLLGCKNMAKKIPTQT